ncbi:MAG: type IV pilin [Halobacteriales archaeon]
MVAVTVLLAATAATFFIGYGDSLTGSPAPTVAVDGEFAVDGGSHELTVEFKGGDVVQRDRVRVHVANAECLGHGVVSDRFSPGPLGVSGAEVAAGTRAEVSVATVCPPSASQLRLSRTEVTVSWVRPGGGESTVLYRWRGPSA